MAIKQDSQASEPKVSDSNIQVSNHYAFQPQEALAT